VTFEHKGYDPKFCKASVAHGTRAPTFHQCFRKPSNKDGWCWQHHPDAEKERDEKRMREYEEGLDRSSRNRNKAGGEALLNWLETKKGVALDLRVYFDEWDGSDPGEEP
jgi:hypothetical protein